MKIPKCFVRVKEGMVEKGDIVTVPSRLTVSGGYTDFARALIGYTIKENGVYSPTDGHEALPRGWKVYRKKSAIKKPTLKKDVVRKSVKKILKKQMFSFDEVVTILRRVTRKHGNLTGIKRDAAIKAEIKKF